VSYDSVGAYQRPFHRLGYADVILCKFT
jgi:hypothetical protein